MSFSRSFLKLNGYYINKQQNYKKDFALELFSHKSKNVGE